MQIPVYVVEPKNILVYKIIGPSETYYYTADKLQLITTPSIHTLHQIGTINKNSHIHPVIIAYDNGMYDIVYTLSDGIKTSDGANATRLSNIKGLAILQVPNLLHGKPGDKELMPMVMSSPNEDMLEKFIEGVDINTPYTNSPSVIFSCPDNGSMDAVESPEKQLQLLTEKTKSLEFDLQETRFILRSLIQRIYKIYDDVVYPLPLKSKGQYGTFITVKDIQLLQKQDNIKELKYDALLLPLGGSLRKQSRMLCIYTKSGLLHFCNCVYNSKTGEVSDEPEEIVDSEVEDAIVSAMSTSKKQPKTKTYTKKNNSK